MSKYLAAYTPPTPPPPAMVAYIHASLLDNGKVRVTVRQQCDGTAVDGDKTAFIEMDPERALDFAQELLTATKAVADEMSHADLRASGGIAGAP